MTLLGTLASTASVTRTLKTPVVTTVACITYLGPLRAPRGVRLREAAEPVAGLPEEGAAAESPPPAICAFILLFCLSRSALPPAPGPPERCAEEEEAAPPVLVTLRVPSRASPISPTVVISIWKGLPAMWLDPSVTASEYRPLTVATYEMRYEPSPLSFTLHCG